MADATEEIKNKINDILASSGNLPPLPDESPKSNFNLQKLFDIDDKLDFNTGLNQNDDTSSIFKELVENIEK